MSNDEFFMDDEIIISIDDSMIDEVLTNVTVTEERFKDDATVRLNNDQINAELTNLIVDRYRISSVLKNKVVNYAKLFLRYPEVRKIQFKALKPIVYADKLTYFSSEEDHIQNKEYEKEHFMKSEKLSNFISQFHNINRDKSRQSALQSTNILYALYAPFASREDAGITVQRLHVDVDVDAMRHCVMEEFDCGSEQPETVRLLSQVKQDDGTVLYEGDRVNVIGFYNMVDRTKPFMTFDMFSYLTNLHTLEEGERVLVVFNDAAFDTKGDSYTLVRTIKGKVVDIQSDKLVIELSTPVTYKGETVKTVTYSLTHPQPGFFVYTENTPTNEIYTKHMLRTQNILFKFPSSVQGNTLSIEDMKAFIAPASVGELIMIHETEFKHINNLQDLATLVLIPNNINIDHIGVDVHDLLIYVFACDKDFTRVIKSVKKTRELLPYLNTTPLTDFKKNATHLVEYKYDYPSYDQYVDDALNRFRYLKSQNDKGAYFLLHVLKNNITKKYKKHSQSLGKFTKELQVIESTIDNLKLPNTSSTVEDPCQRKYAKEYKSKDGFDKLVADNNKPVFHDKQFDTTPYHLKKDFVGENSKELKLYVLNALVSDSKYKRLSKNQLDFEVSAIIAGKRPVSVGDACILRRKNGDIVYVRQLVEGKDMWVKKFRAPFTICTDSPVVDYDDLVKVDTCIRLTFEDLCASNKNAKVLYKYKTLSTLKTELSKILSLLENYNQVIDLIEKDIEYYKSIICIIPSEHVPKRKLEYTEHVDYEEFAGAEGVVGDVEYQIDFTDQANYVVAPNYTGPQGFVQNPLTKHDNYDTLAMLLSFIQLSLDEKEIIFMLQTINHRFPKESIATALDRFKTQLMEQVNEAVYKSSEKYMKLFDAVVKQKLAKREEELLKKYYFNVFRYLIALIIIVIFVRYPNYVMNRIHPSCVRLLGYMGYPVSDKDTQKSLVSYFACLITNISVAEDTRFALFYQKSSQDIQKDLTDAIDDVLANNYELRTQLQLTQTIMQNHKRIKSQTSDKSHQDVFPSFKPSSTFGNLDRMSKKNKSILKFLKSIKDVVSNSKILKQNGLNIPNLFNACCTETLLRDVDFYKFFEGSQEYKVAKGGLIQGVSTVFVDENLHPPMKSIQTVDMFSKLNITQVQTVSLSRPQGMVHGIEKKPSHANKLIAFMDANPKTFGSNMVIQQMAQNFDSHNWWVDNFYQALPEEIETFRLVVSKVTDHMDVEAFEYLKDIIVNVSGGVDVSTVRQTVYSFLTSKLRLTLGKVFSKQKFDIDTSNEEAIRANPVYGILMSIANNKNYEGVISKLRTLVVSLEKVENLFLDATDEDMIVKNISLVTFIIFTMFKYMLLTTLDTRDLTQASLIELTKTTDIKTKDNLRITCDIIMYCMTSLKTSLQNTIVDQTKLKQTVEALREQRKQELIAAYRVDDEERELQKRLKKMGLESWADILTGEDELMTEEQKTSDQLQAVVKDEYEEEKDHVYNAYKGENDDEGTMEENDEDEFVSYEAYNN